MSGVVTTGALLAGVAHGQCEPELVVSAVKVAEDGNGIVIRTYNPTPNAIEGFLEFSRAPESVSEIRLDEQIIVDRLDRLDPGLPRFGLTWESAEIKTFKAAFNVDR